MPDCRSEPLSRTIRSFITLALAAAGVVGSSCGKRNAAVVAAPPAENLSSMDAPVVRGSPSGLEMCVVTTREREGAVAASLAPFLSRPIPGGEAARALWSRHGLRIVTVPVDELDAVTARLAGRDAGSRSAVSRHWLGQVPRWTEAHRGADRPQGQVVALDGERLALGAGRLRLLVRCWTAPTPDLDPDLPPRASLIVELLPQHQESGAASRAAAEFSLSPAERTIDRDGLAFERLTVSLTLEAGTALVIAHERPGREWTETLPSSPGSPEQDRPVAEYADASPGIGRVTRTPPVSDAPVRVAGAEAIGVDIGPPAAVAPTIGEALLSTPLRGGADPVLGSSGAVRTVLIFIPRLPARFDLIGQ